MPCWWIQRRGRSRFHQDVGLAVINACLSVHTDSSRPSFSQSRNYRTFWYIRRVNSTPYTDRLRSFAVWKCLIRGFPQPYLVQSTTHLLLTPRLPKVSGLKAVLFFISATSVHESMMDGFVIVLSFFSLSKIHGLVYTAKPTVP